MSKTVLLTGLTGNVGRYLVGSLAGADLKLRALVRSAAAAESLTGQGIEAFIGDLDDPSTLAPAFEGAETLWLVTQLGPRAPENSMNAVWAARQAGVGHVVRLSAIGAAHDAPTRNGRLHALSDAEVAASGMNWTILRPHFFMQNLLASVDSVAGQGAMYMNMGEGGLGMIDARDIADAAAAVLADPSKHAGTVYTLTGPSSVTLSGAAAAISAAIGKPVKYIPVPSEAARGAMVGAGLTAWVADALIEYGEAYASGWGDFTTADLSKIGRREPRSIEQFAADFAPAFRGA
jgi:uncharacterized protein YbjT (DUF2867 family)